MAIIVGVDSYVTPEEAQDYIQKHYRAEDEKAPAWNALSESDREVCLRQATENLQRLGFLGRKLRGGLQILAFPRVYACPMPMRRNGELVYLDGNYGQGMVPEVPDDIKKAQIEEALEMACPTEDTEEMKQRGGAINSYSVGGLSESVNTLNPKVNSPQTVLSSKKARELVMHYVGGGYRVV